MVILKNLAEELGLDRSNFRKLVLSWGFAPQKIRTKESRNQSVLAVTEAEAAKIREKRSEGGFSRLGSLLKDDGLGVFYVVRLDPAWTRVKVGYSSNMQTRLAEHRTCNPNCKIEKTWPCRRTWERAAMDLISSCEEIKHVGGEVFDFENLGSLIDLADRFFELMPDLLENVSEK